ncbi:MAG: thiamine ABC transporter substrate binding subunit [Aliishimia sp.]
MKYTILAAGLLATTAAFAETPVLTVYTYDSFVTDWGPGPAVETAFEAICDCDLQFEAAGDGAALLAKLRLEGARSDADVVLGLDTNLIATAMETGLFTAHDVDAKFDLPIAWNDDTFVPYDWGHFAFVMKKDAATPTDFKALGASDLKIVIQDPRSSTPGLGLLMWVKTAYGDEAPAVWEALSDNVLTVTKGWSEAYGLFLDGEADAVLSYTTSPSYHRIAEEDDTKTFATFSEGHYMQVEVAAKLAASDQPELAHQFLQFMVTDAFQSVIPTTNWMFPAVLPEGGLPDGFAPAVSPEKSLLLSPADAASLRDAALDEWRTALSQ